MRALARRWLLSSRTWFWVGMVALTIWGIGWRFALIERAYPYCRHVDENVWMASATNILRTGDLNPHRFTKPSVMVYLDTAGLALGLVRAGAKGDPVRRPGQLRKSGGYPYYYGDTAVLTVKQIYALLSMATLILGAVYIRRLTKNDLAALLAMVLALSSVPFLTHSWHYLGVDILGCFFAMAAIGWALFHDDDLHPGLVLAVGGGLAGLTLGCKYNLFWIAVPYLILIWTTYAKHRLGLSSLFVGCMGLSFLLTTPYALFDAPQFVKQAAAEAAHYATGHHGEAYDAGLPMLKKYLDDLTDTFSPGIVILSLAGIWELFRKDWRKALIFVSYPLLLLAYMCKQKTFFARNLLILHVFVPILAAVALPPLHRFLKRQLSQRWSSLGPNRALAVAALLLTLPLALSTPWIYIIDRHDLAVESRNEAERWLFANVRSGRELLVPKQLGLKLKALKEHFRVTQFNLEDTSFSELRREHKGAIALFPRTTTDEGFEAPAKTRVLERFGSRNVDLNPDMRPHVPLKWGNPEFFVLQLPD